MSRSSDAVGEQVRAFIATHGPVLSIDTKVIGTRAHGVVLWLVVSVLTASDESTLDITWRQFLDIDDAHLCARTRSKQIRKFLRHQK